MPAKTLRFVTVAFLAMGLLSCSSSTEPLHDNVDLARNAWLRNHPRAYSFEVATAGSWIPGSGYIHVQVADGHVIAASDSAGKVVTDFTVTVDWLWDRLLTARANGELNSVLFNQRGVPVETDMGPWPVDGGVHYSVREFVAR